MNRSITDIELSLTLSEPIADEYLTALEFIHSNPDYSLMKFRELANSVVDRLAHENELVFETNKLADKIQELHQAQIISNPLRQDLHKVRKLGNQGVHKVYGDGEDPSFHAQRKKRLIESAEEARDRLISIFEDLFLHNNSHYHSLNIKKAAVGNQEYKEILYEASISSDFRLKLKAGLVIEAIKEEQTLSAPLAVSNEFYFHSASLLKIAAGFYEAAYQISAELDSLDTPLPNSEEENSYILRHCALEPLFRYAVILLSGDLEQDMEERGKICLRAAADRDYPPAQATLGALLYEEGGYSSALGYLSRAADRDNPTALRFLYHYFSDGNACPPDSEKALGYLNLAVEMDCPDSLATLGEAYHKGILVTRDDNKARQLLEQSIEKGSFFGKRYLSVEFNPQVARMEDRLRQYQKAMQTLQPHIPPELKQGKHKIRPNDPCFCGSGLKYKKCCRNKLN